MTMTFFLMELIHLIFGPPLFLLSSIFFQHYCLYQRTLPSHDVPEKKLQFCHFCYSTLNRVQYLSHPPPSSSLFVSVHLHIDNSVHVHTHT